MKKFCTEKSKALHEETKKYLVDGVGSFFHITSYGEYPIAITHAKGSRLYDVDGNEYIDYVLGFGPMLCGHCNPTVDAAVRAQIDRGTHFSAPTGDLLKLSKKMTEIIPSAECVTFQNSGTEVVMTAMRLARAYTGRYKIIKFEGQYHGWSDEEKISIDAKSIEEMGDREHPNKIIHTKGQRLTSADDLIVLPWNDLDILERYLPVPVREPVFYDGAGYTPVVHPFGHIAAFIPGGEVVVASSRGSDDHLSVRFLRKVDVDPGAVGNVGDESPSFGFLRAGESVRNERALGHGLLAFADALVDVLALRVEIDRLGRSIFDGWLVLGLELFLYRGRTRKRVHIDNCPVEVLRLFAGFLLGAGFLGYEHCRTDQECCQNGFSA